MSLAETEPPRPRWFAAGDPLRGLASLTIVAFHCGFNIAVQAGATSFESQFGYLFRFLYRGGELSLQVFFVLSTYLIGRGFIEAYVEGRPAPDLRRYLRNRALRILPAYWVVYTVVLLARGLDGQSAFAAGKLYVFGGLIDNRGLSPTMGQTWSLGIEVAFYLLVPLVFVVAMRRRGRGKVRHVLVFGTVVIAASLALRGSRDPTLLWLRAFPSMAYALMPGLMLAALGLRVRPGSVPRALPAAMFAGGLGLLAVGGILVPELTGTHVVLIAAITSASAALLVGGPLVLYWDGRPAWRWLDNPPLHWVGTRAYGLFLVHQAIILTLLENHVDFGYGAKGVVGLYLIAAPLSLAAAAVVYRFVERPALERMKRWQPRRALAPVS